MSWFCCPMIMGQQGLDSDEGPRSRPFCLRGWKANLSIKQAVRDSGP